MLSSLQRQILGAINSAAGLSRTELAQVCGMSKAAIGGVVREMIDAGYLHESETVNGPGQGRPSVRLMLRPEGAYFIGVSLLQTPAQMALINLQGEIIARAGFTLSREPEALAQNIAHALPDLLEGHTDAAARLIGMGVTLSGFIDENQSTCVQSALLGWRDVPLASLVAAATGLEVFIENDAKALAVSEKRFGQARDLDTFTLVSHGAGIGSAHFIAGRLHRGLHGGAGEIAHCTLELNGTPCRCGKRGCLDTIASLNAIMEMAREENLGLSSLAELEQLASGGSAAAIRILHRAGTALGLAIAQLIQILDPSLILIAHQAGAFGGLLGTVVQQSIETNVLPGFAGLTPVRTFPIDEDTWVRAAASIAAHRFLDGPDNP
ncbi:ROK family transcriptional regulator [Rouxiella badensis]|jgi:predicted NBD/HSP70 family sugar kinase|uniref:Transcriptional regulator n=1 Tax=Rouxiella badensis TaxID=1646377 RepID=A0A1X0WG88_9GAMM|nr:ROK family transcriptional regulator [Rouxiella badensis]MCC3735396.1 ROK family transcriptional regulator [Rouxiella badensis]MCC3746320.1 ROK family transcriptional regulator [Rouxiella badensis]MCC3760693.1 ROK family transcriptional regulator [Rouxiella badensis]ORJ25733.1 transcriptional regulator [Rouxiella badensis]WAT03391.1 ROK family transcriptional regulator [Rouxiella badensis]